MKILFTLANRHSLLVILLALSTLVTLAQNVPIELVRLELTGETYTDEIVVYTDSNATVAFDGQYDSEKVPNFLPGPTFASMSSDGVKLHINGIPKDSFSITIPLSVIVGVTGNYTITATELSGFTGNTQVYFMDVLLGDTHSLHVTPAYSFSFTTTDPDTGRFYLNFVPDSLVTSSSVKKKQKQFEVNPVENGEWMLILKNYGELKSVNMFDMSGREIELKYNGIDGVYQLKHPLNLSVGVYLLSISTSDGVLSKKIFISPK